MADIEEYMCGTCSHNKVCKFIEDYTDAVKAVKDSHIYKTEDDGKVQTTYIQHLDFIEIQNPKCKHYLRNTPIPRDINFGDPTFSDIIGGN